ncbi:MAG: glycosyltransferase family protein [Acidiferrobacterales bacterium]
MAQKMKVLTISDHPLVPSGVGSQAKYLIEGLLNTGKYTIRSFGGAIDHPDYRPQKVAPEKFGDDWIIYPVKGFGDKNILRQALMAEKPDALFIFTDPRFFVWIWEMEDEIRSVCPLLYWHVWDNDPTPKFNRIFYESTDFISALSLKTYGLLQDMPYPVDRFNYIPHALPADLFKPLPETEILKFKHDHFGPHKDKKFILFWNNRNARRKQTGDVIGSFAKFAKVVGKENVSLMMHTSVHDPEGQDITAVSKMYDVEDALIISEARVAPEELNRFYNTIDCTINIASNEGFGLGTLESLFAGTPIVVHMTGGLQFQIGPWWEGLKDFTSQDKLTELAKRKLVKGNGEPSIRAACFGEPVFPAARSCTGSQQIPYIYDDRVNQHEVAEALLKMYKMGRPARKELGLKGREWAIKTFDMGDMIKSWDTVFQDQIKKFQARSKQNIRIASL